jgi:eukaryotic-like serine/threonine-protein kinase
MLELSALTAGQVFASRYRVVRCIAAGGMGAVYEATHTETDRRCAVKVMLPHIVADASMRDRFKREARVTAHIGSEFIVDVLDAGVDETTQAPFLVMEYLEGHDLSVELANSGRLLPENVVTYLWQTAMALHKTHAANIVHRDLKPENIFLTKRDDGSPRVKILDFGISKVIESSTKGNATMTLGTPMYMAPEQFKGTVAPATDIYALGMIAYTLLVGVAYWTPDPDEEASVFALATKVLDGIKEPASVRALRQGAELPGGFDDWFSLAVARDPKERFAGALDAISALGAIFGIELKSALMPGISSSIRPPPADPVVAGSATAMTSSKDGSGQQRAPARSRTGMMLGVGGVIALALGGVIFAVRPVGAPGVTDAHDSIPLVAPPPPASSASPPATSPIVVLDVVASPPTASSAPSASSAPVAQPPPSTKDKKAAKSSETKTGAAPTPPATAVPVPANTSPYGRY